MSGRRSEATCSKKCSQFLSSAFPTFCSYANFQKSAGNLEFLQKQAIDSNCNGDQNESLITARSLSCNAFAGGVAWWAMLISIRNDHTFFSWVTDY